MSPEAEGETGAFFLHPAGAGGSHDWIFSTDPLTVPPAETTAQPDFTHLNLYSQLGTGIADRWNISLEYSQGIAPMVVGKYQFYGASRGDAQAGNISGAVTLGLGYNEGSMKRIITGTQQNTFNQVLEVGDIGVIGGYRFFPELMAYSGFSMQFFRISGARVWLDGTTELQRDEFKISGELKTFHVGLEWIFSEWGLLMIEQSFTGSSILNTKFDGFASGVQLGFLF